MSACNNKLRKKHPPPLPPSSPAMSSPRKLTKRSIVHCTYLSDDDIASARSANVQPPPPPSAYSRFNDLLHSSPAKRSISLSFKSSRKKHHKGRLSLDADRDDDYYHFVQPWLPPLNLGSPVFNSPLSAPHSPRPQPPPAPISGLASDSHNITITARNPLSIPPTMSPLPRARTLSHIHSQQDILHDVDWDPDYCLDEWHASSPSTHAVKPKFTIGADEDQEDLRLLPSSPSDITSNSDEWNPLDSPSSHHVTHPQPRRPSFTRRHAAFPFLSAAEVTRRWTLSMALMDDSLSDELLIKHLERAVTIPRSSNRVAATPGGELGLSPTTVKLITRITQDLSTSPPTTLYPPLPPLPALSPHMPNSTTAGGLEQGSLEGDYRSRPLPPLPIPSSSPPTRDDDAHASTSHRHPRYIIQHPRNGNIHPHHPTFRHALLTVRELIRTEKSYLESLRLLLDYPPHPPTSPHWYGVSPAHDDGGEDDSNEVSSNSHSQSHSQSHGQHSPSRSTSFAHNNSYNTQYHPFPQYKSPSPQIPPSHSPLLPSFSPISHPQWHPKSKKRQAKYTPPPLMRAYVVELVKVSEALVRKMERDLCVRGVAGAFVGMCESTTITPPPSVSLSSSLAASSPRPIATTTHDLNYTSSEFGSWDVLKKDDGDDGWGCGGGDSYDAPASLENVYVAWCGVVGSWFADRSLGGEGEDSDVDMEEGKKREKERRRKEKSSGGRRLSKTRRLSMLVGVGGGKEEIEKKANVGSAGTTPGGLASPPQTTTTSPVLSYTTNTTTTTPSTNSESNSTTQTPHGGKPLTPGMRSKSSTSLKRTMSQWRKSLPSMPSLPGLLGGNGSSSSSSPSGGRPRGGGAAMTVSVYEGGPPLPPLPAHLIHGGSKGVGVDRQRLRQQTLPPQLTMTTVSGTVGSSVGGVGVGVGGGARKAFEIPGRTSIAFSEDGGGNVGGGAGGGGKQRRGFELRREVVSEVGHQQRVMELASPVTTKKSASLCDGGSIGVVGGSGSNGNGNGNEGRGNGGTVTRSKSAVVVRRGDAGHGGSHLKERLSGVILGSKVHADGGKMKSPVTAPPVPVAGGAGTGLGEEKVKPRQRRLPTVRDLAILPTQRVMRYVLLFRDLLAHTPHTSPSREIVEKAVDAAVRVAQKCDRAQGNAAFLRPR